MRIGERIVKNQDISYVSGSKQTLQNPSTGNAWKKLLLTLRGQVTVIAGTSYIDTVNGFEKIIDEVRCTITDNDGSHTIKSYNISHAIQQDAIYENMATYTTADPTVIGVYPIEITTSIDYDYQGAEFNEEENFNPSLSTILATDEEKAHVKSIIFEIVWSTLAKVFTAPANVTIDNLVAEITTIELPDVQSDSRFLFNSENTVSTTFSASNNRLRIPVRSGNLLSRLYITAREGANLLQSNALINNVQLEVDNSILKNISFLNLRAKNIKDNWIETGLLRTGNAILEIDNGKFDSLLNTLQYSQVNLILDVNAPAAGSGQIDVVVQDIIVAP